MYFRKVAEYLNYTITF